MIRRIVQILPSFQKRDAIGNHAYHMSEIIRDEGYESAIYAERGGDGSLPIQDFLSREDESSLAIFHFSTGSEIPYLLARFKGYVVTDFHNITPSVYFAEASDTQQRTACRLGELQVELVRSVSNELWADSDFNGDQLLEQGFSSYSTLPILRDYSRLKKLAEAGRVLSSDKNNIVFVGRFAPNKAQHDIVRVFSLYQKNFDRRGRLVLVGSHSGEYKNEVMAYAEALGLKVTTQLDDSSADVVAPGSITDSDLARVYRDAQAFLCLSDHEGFCVPILEAMSFGVPVVAHKSTALGETVGSGGILVDKAEPMAVLSSLYKITHDSSTFKYWQERSLDRVKELSLTRTRQRFVELLNGAVRRRLDCNPSKDLS